MKRFVLLGVILVVLTVAAGGIAYAQQAISTPADLAMWNKAVEVKIDLPLGYTYPTVRVNSMGIIHEQDGCEFLVKPNAVACQKSVESVMIEPVPGSRHLLVQVQLNGSSTPQQQIKIPVMPSGIRTLFASVGGTKEAVMCVPQNDFGWQCELPVGRLDVNPPVRLSTFWGYAVTEKGFGGLKPPPDVFSARFTPDVEKSVQVECAIMVTLDVNCSLEEYGVFLVDFVEPEKAE